jgi:hypothetical protein
MLLSTSYFCGNERLVNTPLNRVATYMSLHGISWELIAKRGIGHEGSPSGIVFLSLSLDI